MKTIQDLKKYSDTLPDAHDTMPALFIGHGDPMNAIKETEFSDSWKLLGTELPRPLSILCISAHWETRGTFVTAMEHPKTIHDFSGFPEQLFEVQYPAPGNPSLAQDTKEAVTHTNVGLDNSWGLDHGCWSVVRRMYPAADIPVIQLSLDHFQSPQWHYDLARDLYSLRKKGVLLLGSGNMVHNLGRIDWEHPDSAYDWAQDANELFKRYIMNDHHRDLVHYTSLGKAAALSVPTPEHFLPMLYMLGLKQKNETIEFFNDKTVMGSLSMTSFKIF